MKRLEECKSNDEVVKQLGIEITADICKKLSDKGMPYFHFYTLNLERSCTEVIRQLGFQMPLEKELPWKKVI